MANKQMMYINNRDFGRLYYYQVTLTSVLQVGFLRGMIVSIKSQRVTPENFKSQISVSF